MKNLFALKFIALFVVLALLTGLVTQKVIVDSKASQPQPIISECDSLHLANDSLIQEIKVLDRRLTQYKIGMWFLKDKNREAYNYVINAGNFKFEDQW